MQFAGDGLIALFELTVQDDRIVILRENHYKLVPSNEITATDLSTYMLAANEQ